MPVSAPDRPSAGAAAAGVGIAVGRADVTELALARNRMPELEGAAAAHGFTFPPIGRAVATANALVLGVRPDRWLLLTAADVAGATAARWQERFAGLAVAVDQSAGLAALLLTGPNARDLLARGCRLDLAGDRFSSGRAAATSIAQVATILAALPAGILILTPASTARHLHEWLLATARPFGLAPSLEISASTLFGYPDS